MTKPTTTQMLRHDDELARVEGHKGEDFTATRTRLTVGRQEQGRNTSARHMHTRFTAARGIFGLGFLGAMLTRSAFRPRQMPQLAARM